MIGPYVPRDVLNVILEYDGRLKYKKGKYVDIIHKHDIRYNMVDPIIKKKTEIMKHAEIHGEGFYFEFAFDIDNRVGLCFDYNFSYENKFEICYYDTRCGWLQIRTYL